METAYCKMQNKLLCSRCIAIHNTKMLLKNKRIKEESMKKRMKKMAMLMMALALSLTVAMPVKAEKRSWEFNKPVTSEKEYFVLTRGSKADNEQNWYVTTKSSKYTNISRTNKFQCKVVDKNAKTLTKEVSFSDYDTKKTQYDKGTAYKGSKYRLEGRKNPASTTKGNLVVWGFFTP